MPIFSKSSSAMRSSPQVGLLVVISAISCRNWAGMRGRPRGRDLRFQNKRKPLRCQRINVSGLTMVRAFRQSNRQDSRANVKRMASVARRGFAFRSIKSPSCLRRKRFSAATVVVGVKQSSIKVHASRKDVEDIPNHVQKRLHDSILLSH